MDLTVQFEASLGIPQGIVKGLHFVAWEFPCAARKIASRLRDSLGARL